jgi:putative oxidoreductase
MGFVFLIVRLVVGGYFAWAGVQRLDAYNRALLVADARRRNAAVPLVTVPLTGLMLMVGGVSVVAGVFVAAGVAMLLAVLVPSAVLAARADERRGFWRDVALAVIALALLAVPQPWPLTMVG